MPLMTKIRENMTRAFAIFAGIFVIYIILDWGMDITGRKQAMRASESQEIGSVNGDPIRFRDFSELVRQTSESQKAQTGTEPDESQLRAIRDQIWNQLIEERLYDEEIKRLGITVTNQEIIDAVRGDAPPEFLRTQFTDSTGTFNRQAYDAAIMDPKNKEVVRRVEDVVRKQREREKLQSILLASVHVTEDEITQRFADQNQKYTLEYVLLDPNVMVTDDEVKPTEEEIREFYNEQSSEFKMEASRKLKYVLFSEAPSKSDSEAIARDFADIRRRAEAGADFKDLASTYSETPVTDAFFKHGELSAEKENAIFDASAGAILGPLQEADGYHLVKVLEFRNGTDDFIRARHVLIAIQNNDSASALKRAREVLAQAKSGADFAALAAQYSTEPGAAERGGDLGWFGKGRMVKPFEDAVFKAKPGQIIGPVKTQFGYHVIHVQASDNREVKLVDIHMTFRASSQTRNDIMQHAQEFAFHSKSGNFAREAEQNKYNVAETPSIQKNTTSIPGLGQVPAVVRFAFDGKLNDVSDAIPLDNGYAVFMISEAKEAGMRPLEEVRASIESRVKREKKMKRLEQIAAELKQSLSPSDGLGKLTAQRANLAPQQLTDVTMGGFLPGIGRDMSFVGGVTRLNVGEVSTPIAGQRGVYLVKLLQKTPFDTNSYKTSRDQLYTQMLSEKRNRFYSEWRDNLRKSAEIVDNRDLFYR